MSALAAIKASTILGSIMRSTSAAVGSDRTFTPKGFVVPGVSRWVDESGGISVGQPVYTQSLRLPTKTSRIYRVQSKLVVPTLEALAPAGNGFTPAPTKAYEITGNFEAMIPERSTAAERLIFYNLMLSFFLGTINASDDAPTDLTGSPLPGAIQTYDQPF